MVVVELYDNIYTYLSNDDTLLGLLGLGTSSSLTDKVLKIRKRHRPENLVDGLPLIAYYTPGGGVSSTNNLVYEAFFIFDIYTEDDVTLAHSIGERICEIFDRTIPAFENMGNLEVRLMTGHESSTDYPNTYCFTVILEFSVNHIE